MTKDHCISNLIICCDKPWNQNEYVFWNSQKDKCAILQKFCFLFLVTLLPIAQLPHCNINIIFIFFISSFLSIWTNAENVAATSLPFGLTSEEGAESIANFGRRYLRNLTLRKVRFHHSQKGLLRVQFDLKRQRQS